MNGYGIILMALSWSAILSLSTYCVWKILALGPKKGQGAS